jgi:hypothetical protein
MGFANISKRKKRDGCIGTCLLLSNNIILLERLQPNSIQNFKLCCVVGGIEDSQ